MPATGNITWGQTTLTLNVGESAQLAFDDDMGNGVTPSAFNNYIDTDIAYMVGGSHDVYSPATIVGVSPGTVTVPVGAEVEDYTWWSYTTNQLTITVVGEPPSPPTPTESVKVVQLQDNGVNIDPVTHTRAITHGETDLQSALDAKLEAPITTDKIENGAAITPSWANGSVTSDKIDWSTMGKVLWTGDSNGAITLSESVANYKAIVFVYRTNDNREIQTQIAYNDFGASFQIQLFSIHCNATYEYIKTCTKTVSGNKITNPGYAQQVRIATGAATYTADNTIYLKKVIGIKENF